MSKISKPKPRPKPDEGEYELLTELTSLDDIPNIGLKILKSLGKNQIKVGSAKNMLYLLKYVDALALSTMDRVSKQKYKLICEVADQIQNNKIVEITKLKEESFEDDELELD